MNTPFSKYAILLPLLSAGLLLSACEQASGPQSSSVEEQGTITSSNSNPDATQAPLSSGNMFYIVRDVADLQLKAGQYVEQLNQSKSELQTAINAQDPQQLQLATTQLQQQLHGFNQTLSSLDLKTQEIDTIRQNLLAANQQVLNSPFLNGQINLSQVDFKKLEQQMGNIQSEMVKLAGMILQGEATPNSKTDAADAS
ncbi:hypothetical protein [Acinetobacter sp. A2]|uniref:hypothetical protein n=1 Tax=Acinetobacter sp. A2 TaxID=362457 RepID=UPI001444A169|nr:hypothetical protein [Acinetobacter sp. A2]